MIVQRLTNWLASFVARSLARMRGATPPAATSLTMRSPVSARATSQGAPTTSTSGANWLTDAQRLRPPHPHLPPNTPPISRKSFLTMRAIPTVPPPPPLRPPLERHQPPQSISSHADASRPTAPDSQTMAQIGGKFPPSQPLHQQSLTPSAPRDPQSENASRLIPDQTDPEESAIRYDVVLRRRLMSLKRLVRLGVYNEGFSNGAAPEQYHHSLGLDDIFTDD